MRSWKAISSGVWFRTEVDGERILVGSWDAKWSQFGSTTQHFDCENFLNVLFECERGDRFARDDVQYPDSAGPLGQPLGDGDTTEDGTLADLGKSDEGELATEVQSAGKSW